MLAQKEISEVETDIRRAEAVDALRRAYKMARFLRVEAEYGAADSNRIAWVRQLLATSGPSPLVENLLAEAEEIQLRWEAERAARFEGEDYW